MACTSLIAQQRQPMYFPLLDIANGSVSPAGSDLNGNKEMTGPGVRGLQAWIENAWHNGNRPRPLCEQVTDCEPFSQATISKALMTSQ